MSPAQGGRVSNSARQYIYIYIYTQPRASHRCILTVRATVYSSEPLFSGPEILTAAHSNGRRRRRPDCKSGTRTCEPGWRAVHRAAPRAHELPERSLAAFGRRGIEAASARALVSNQWLTRSSVSERGRTNAEPHFTHWHCIKAIVNAQFYLQREIRYNGNCVLS